MHEGVKAGAVAEAGGKAVGAAAMKCVQAGESTTGVGVEVAHVVDD